MFVASLSETAGLAFVGRVYRGLRLFLIFTITGLTFAVFPASAETSSRVTVATRAGVHDSFDRVVFDWPVNVSYKVATSGGHTTITFGSEANININAFISAKLKRIRNFSVDKNAEGQLVVGFDADDGVSIKDFINGKSVVVDIASSLPALKDNKAASKEEQKDSRVNATVPKGDGTDDNKPTAKIEGNVITFTPPASPVARATKSVAAPETVPAANNEPAVQQPLQDEIVVMPQKQQKTLQNKVAIKPLNQPPALEVGSSPELVLALDTRVETGAAVFMRGGYGYIIFDRKLNLDFASITSGQISPRVALEAIDLPNNAGYRFAVPRGLELRANRKGPVWQLFLSRQWRDNPVSGGLVAQPDFALGARLLLSTINPPDPVRFYDPVVGDDLMLLPLSQLDAFGIKFSFAEFETIPSAQGLVIKPLIDKLIVHKVTDGIEITSANGLMLSPFSDVSLFEKATKKERPASAGKVFFDFPAWSGKRDESFTEARQRLMQTIVDVRDVERNKARLDLARFYFARGFGAEAESLLKFLAQEDPDLKNYPEFIALIGAAKILAGHPESGLQDLNNQEIRFQPEIKLWQAVGEVQLRQWDGAEEKFSITQPLFANYPEPFFSKFYVLAIEAAIATGKDREAAEWLAEIDMEPHSPTINGALDYLRAVLHSKAGRQVMAEDLWKKALRSSDRLYQVRAKLALIDLGVATKSLTPAQAAEQLEAMRFVWRGDELELDILHRLGLFYLDAKNMKAALSTLAQAVKLFPDSPVAAQIRTEMTGVLRSIFAEGSDQVSPLEALSLYKSFSELMPEGSARNATVLNIVERLVSIDLLDQAASLLEGLIKDSLQGEEKIKAGTRLAAIRLLDHKPDAAIAALALVPEDNMPAAVVAERKILRARALSEQGKNEEALALLENNHSKPAELLRADIGMKTKRWADAAKTLMDLVGPPPKEGELVSAEQAQWLVNCAVALALAGDVGGLDRLAIDYSSAMTGLPQNDTFRILTRPERVGQLRDISSVQSRIAEVDLFKGFLNNYRNSSTHNNR